MSISTQLHPRRPESTAGEQPTTGSDDWSEIHALAQRIARASTHNTALAHGDFAEDIAQDVTLSLLKQSGGALASRSLIGQVTRNVVARASHANRTGLGRENYGQVNSADMKAWKMLAARRSELESTLGRALSRREIDAMVAQIRDQWEDPRHKPRADFHVDVRYVAGESGELSLYDASGYHERSAEEKVLNQDVEEGTFMAAALDALDSPTADGRDRTPLRLLHNAIAENRGVPVAVAGSLSQRRCTRARKLVGTTSEEVLAVVEDWAGGIDDERTELLFAPYGELSTAGRNAVAEMYRDLEPYAGDLYASALMYANTRQLAER